jgi:lysyl-tRNA synthetase class 2
VAAVSPWFDKKRHEDRRGFLHARNRILTAYRNWFGGEGFVEVDVAALAVSPGNEAHLHGFETDIMRPDGDRATLYLHTSPEFACKKLLAAGEEKIFSLGHVFRNRERTATHSPEFTMLEWYRAGSPYDAVIADTVSLMRLAAEVCGRSVWHWREQACDVHAEPQRLTVQEAFLHHAGLDLLSTLSAAGAPDRAKLARLSPVAVADDDSWSDIFSRILSDRVEPHLGVGRLTILDQYPACEAALARTCTHDRRVAERFEAYVCGVELCNGFGELTDPAEQRRRFEEEMEIKARVYGERYPIDEELLAALAHMPEASGVAVGFDRVAMLATGARRIEEVQWTPVP